MSRRLNVVATGILVLFLVVAIQAVNIQFFRSKALSASPINPRNISGQTLFPRGEIVAADGTILARSVATSNGYSPWTRVYPLGALTAGVVGFSSPSYGPWALEAQYNSYLTAHAQPPQSLAQLLAPQTAADSLTITLEPQLQRVARAAIGAQDGAAVVLDPRTGAVLAMYSNPSYDPAPMESTTFAVAKAQWKKITTPNAHFFEPLALMATQYSFPPGSTMKVVTTSAVLLGRPDLLNKFYPVKTTISLPQSNRTLSNFGFGSCGGTIAEMLPPSCDTGFALVGMDLGGALLSSTAQKYGFNSSPPLDLPNVQASSFPSAATLKYNLPADAYSAIGQQNVRETALQNALVAAAIANHGVMMTPHLMDYITGPDGTILQHWKDTAYLTPLSPTQAAFINALMVKVVQVGTASGVGFPANLDVAAKTGTAQIGNAAHQLDDWMIAFAPASDPTIAVAVVMPFQPVTTEGATVAGPIVKCLVEGALALQAHHRAYGTATTCPD
ncbi:MAG TPA: penicillin-binding transpeptidase domain-containing protein [Acidimicrobiales bacterium]|nr:penicillin-binding transpeptidase domain-containing protein [Acidimicrobiales bacterium]